MKRILLICLGFTSYQSTLVNTFSLNTLNTHQIRSSRDYLLQKGRRRNLLFQSTLSSPAETTAAPPAISIENLSCSHDGETYQLDDVSYVLQQGARVGLVGRNGCGKSTLLKIIADSATSSMMAEKEGIVYRGRITAPRSINAVFVEQEPPTPSDITVADALLGVTENDSNNDNSNDNSIGGIVRRYRLATLNAADDPEEFSSASSAMDERVGCWDVLTKAEEISTKLRVRHLQDMPLSALSGGERKRVALAAALVQDPDVLLLDEPTNHLDLAAIRWLSDLLTEQKSNQKKMTLLVVTHDRAFLEEVCTNILELDQGSLYSYEGNYAAYLEGKEARFALQDAAVQSAKAKYRVELDWMRRQPQARESKSKARIDAFYKLEKATKPRVRDPNLTLETDNRRLGGNILTMKNISLKFGDRVMLDDFNYEFCKGDKIGIVGANGVGKSTFIRVISGEQPVDEGDIDIGETIVLGIYDQMGLKVDDDDQKVMDFVMERVKSRDGSSLAEAPNEARKLLNRFEFPKQRWQERISRLSGGEKRRLQLLSVLTKRPNFLILDEPSNDIDLNTLTALESYLADFNGVLVVVSHDRFFTDKVTNHLFVFEGNGLVKDYTGSLSEYASTLIEQEERTGGETEEKSSSSSSGGPTTTANDRAAKKEEQRKRNEKRNAIRNMKKEINKLESAMEKLKQKANAVQEEIDNTDADEGWSVLAELTDKLQGFNDEIDEKEMRWLEIAEELEQAEEE